MSELTFTVPGRPVPKARPRVTRRGTYTPKRTLDYERLVLMCAQDAAFPPRHGMPPLAHKRAVEIAIRFFFKLPKSWSRKRWAEENGRLHTQRPDLDNLVKAVKDALDGFAYEDDSQIAEISATKRWGTEDGAEVVLKW